jgi:hypothetical protein
MKSNGALPSIPHPNREQALKRARLTAGFQNIVNGQRINSSRSIKISDPVTGEELASVTEIQKDGLEQAVQAAKAAFPLGAARPGTSEGIFFEMPWKSSKLIPMSFARS